MFELAATGTLFLDEIGEMPGALQVKLLRAVQDRKIHRLGGSAPVPVDTRLIAATHRDLEAEVAAGRFREDLYYRLNVCASTCRRCASAATTCRCWQVRSCAAQPEYGQADSRLSTAAVAVLGRYDFPGNVRELENILERAVIFAEGHTIDAADLDLPAGGAPVPGEATTPGTLPSGTLTSGTLKENERNLVVAALSRWEGNRTRAAAELGITRRTLLNKIREFGLR